MATLQQHRRLLLINLVEKADVTFNLYFSLNLSVIISSFKWHSWKQFELRHKVAGNILINKFLTLYFVVLSTFCVGNQSTTMLDLSHHFFCLESKCPTFTYCQELYLALEKANSELGKPNSLWTLNYQEERRISLQHSSIGWPIKSF